MGASSSDLFAIATEHNLNVEQRRRYRQLYIDMLAKGMNEGIVRRKLIAKLQSEREALEKERNNQEMEKEQKTKQRNRSSSVTSGSLNPSQMIGLLARKNSMQKVHIEPDNDDDNDKKSRPKTPISRTYSTPTMLSAMRSESIKRSFKHQLERQSSDKRLQRPSSPDVVTPLSPTNNSSYMGSRAKKRSLNSKMEDNFTYGTLESPEGMNSDVGFTSPYQHLKHGDLYYCDVCVTCSFISESQLERHIKYSHIHAKALHDREQHKRESERMNRIAQLVNKRIQSSRQSSRGFQFKENENQYRNTKARQRWFWAYKKVRAKIELQRITNLLVHHHRLRKDIVSHQSHQIFEGTKFFWRTLETLDIHMYLHDDEKTVAFFNDKSPIVEVVAFHISKNIELPRRYFRYSYIKNPLQASIQERIQEVRAQEINNLRMHGEVPDDFDEKMVDVYHKVEVDMVADKIFRRIKLDSPMDTISYQKASVTESEEPELDPVIKEYAICKHFTPALIGRHMQWNAEAEKQAQEKVSEIADVTKEAGTYRQLASTYEHTASRILERSFSGDVLLPAQSMDDRFRLQG